MRIHIVSIVCISLAAAQAARARPAAAADDDLAAAAELPSGRRALVEATLLGRYEQLPGELHGGSVGLGMRALLGHRLGYCLGADLGVGASERGVIYAAALHLAGVGLRLGRAGLVSVCGGVGVGGAGGAVPAALELPVELRARVQLGPVRVIGWVTGRWTALSEQRDGGSRVDAVDELDATLALGWGRQRSYWQRSSAGSGPYVAVTYRELVGERVIAVAVGVELLGAN